MRPHHTMSPSHAHPPSTHVPLPCMPPTMLTPHHTHPLPCTPPAMHTPMPRTLSLPCMPSLATTWEFWLQSASLISTLGSCVYWSYILCSARFFLRVGPAAHVGFEFTTWAWVQGSRRNGNRQSLPLLHVVSAVVFFLPLICIHKQTIKTGLATAGMKISSGCHQQSPFRLWPELKLR